MKSRIVDLLVLHLAIDLFVCSTIATFARGRILYRSVFALLAIMIYIKRIIKASHTDATDGRKCCRRHYVSKHTI